MLYSPGLCILHSFLHSFIDLLRGDLVCTPPASYAVAYNAESLGKLVSPVYIIQRDYLAWKSLICIPGIWPMQGSITLLSMKFHFFSFTVLNVFIQTQIVKSRPFCSHVHHKCIIAISWSQPAIIDLHLQLLVSDFPLHFCLPSKLYVDAKEIKRTIIRIILERFPICIVTRVKTIILG